MLPPDLNAAVESQITRTGTREIARASAELTDWYRSGRPQNSSFRMTAAHRLAYAAARMPATFAANGAVLQELRTRLPDISFSSQLDLCAGPGTAAWAAAEVLGELESATLLEYDDGFLTLGQQLAAEADHPGLRAARWQQSDLSGAVQFDPHDLVTISYGLGELPSAARQRTIEAAWAAAREALVIVEPGTPAGYATVLAARTSLIEMGALIAAPCPHMRDCPLAATERWCHFVQRLSRTRLHRSAKGADLGYEDEKFSYLIVSRTAPRPFTGRILGPPRELKPAVQMELCGMSGLEQITVAKRDDRETFRRARHARWGDAWPEE